MKYIKPSIKVSLIRTDSMAHAPSSLLCQKDGCPS